MANSSTFRASPIVWLILLACLAYAGYWRYDHAFISPGLRESLTAAVDPASTQSDILEALRNAQAQIHTLRDAELESMLQRAVLLTQSAAEATQQSGAHGKGSSAELDPLPRPPEAIQTKGHGWSRRASRTTSSAQLRKRRKLKIIPTKTGHSINRPPRTTPPRPPSCSSSSAPRSAFPPCPPEAARGFSPTNNANQFMALERDLPVARSCSSFCRSPHASSFWRRAGGPGQLCWLGWKAESPYLLFATACFSLSS